MADSEALCMGSCSFDVSFSNSKLACEKIQEQFINFHTVNKFG